MAAWLAAATCGGGAVYGATVDTDRATAAARRIEAAVSTHKADAAAAMIDEHALFARMTHPIEADPATRGRLTGRPGSLAAGLVRQLTGAVGARGSMRLLRVFDDSGAGGRTLARYRLVTSDGAIGYYDMELTPGTPGTPGSDAPANDTSGGVRIADIVVHASGQPLSRILRRAVLGRMIERRTEWRDTLDQTEQAWVKYVGRIDQMHAHAADGRYEAALVMYARLPTPLGDDRSLMLACTEWASHLPKPATFDAAVGRYVKAFGDDPAITLLRLKRAMAADPLDADGAIKLVDRIDSLLGPDPYLHLLRGRIIAKAGTDDAIKLARGHFEQAAAGAPDVADVYYPLIDDALARKDWPTVTHWLLAAEKNAGVLFGDLSQVPGFEGYTASGEYEKWTNRREASPPTSRDR